MENLGSQDYVVPLQQPNTEMRNNPFTNVRIKNSGEVSTMTQKDLISQSLQEESEI
jgi:hypothetical protein